jgi:hypothetical protein
LNDLQRHSIVIRGMPIHTINKSSSKLSGTRRETATTGADETFIHLG